MIGCRHPYSMITMPNKKISINEVHFVSLYLLSRKLSMPTVVILGQKFGYWTRAKSLIQQFFLENEMIIAKIILNCWFLRTLNKSKVCCKQKKLNSFPSILAYNYFNYHICLLIHLYIDYSWSCQPLLEALILQWHTRKVGTF